MGILGAGRASLGTGGSVSPAEEPSLPRVRGGFVSSTGWVFCVVGFVYTQGNLSHLSVYILCLCQSVPCGK